MSVLFPVPLLMVWRVALNKQSGVYVEATHHRVRLAFSWRNDVKIPGAVLCHEKVGEMTNTFLNLSIFEVFEIWDLGLSNSSQSSKASNATIFENPSGKLKILSYHHDCLLGLDPI